MTYKTHIVGGIALGSIIHLTALQMTGIEMIGYYGCTIVGSLLPDIDHPKSFISRHTLGFHYLFKKCKHRGFTHSLLAVMILGISLCGMFGMNRAVLGVGIGYISHLLLDMLNPRGVPLGYPITKIKCRIGNIKTGENGEYIVLGIIVAVVCYCIYHIFI